MVKNLKKLRNEKGISQQQLASVIGISQQSINKYENHNVEPDIFTLSALADYFGTSVDFLIGRVDTDLADPPTPTEARHLAEYRKLDTKGKNCVDALVKAYTENK